ncbi:pleckstrin homology domain-containing family M member 3 [Synchiropus splendidus]|uniref:pleckstrin homology domain-containing family M member 3 n=1 Tax=Synchiropus splendidus TaxID=270530 RepID=UPI00237DFD40|nr:pleckstrin homology domain-containing family M member 3 [Synchiropus splendidus]XP_053733473.1 pleckstrin homology domain-containing family M member 3 [Synchiropus splendidus]XP_053733474.1 pleckstrin homology domain-containing family M member 3 [Synchiropus splendidus]
MEGLEQLDMLGDISPAVEATEDFVHQVSAIQSQGSSHTAKANLQLFHQSKTLQDVSNDAMGKLSSSGAWNLLASEQPVTGPFGLAWADNLSVLGLVGLGQGKRTRAHSTDDLAVRTKECVGNSAASSTSQFKKGHNRSRSDVNYGHSFHINNDCTMKNLILNHQQAAEKSSSCSVVKRGEMEHREGAQAHWIPCHVELTVCDLRVYTLDSSANLQLASSYSLSHCLSVVSPADCNQVGQTTQSADLRTLQALFFSSTCLQLRTTSTWEAHEWQQLISEKVQAVRPVCHDNEQQRLVSDSIQNARFPAPMTPSSSPSPSGLQSSEAQVSLQSNYENLKRPTTLQLFAPCSQDYIKSAVLHKLIEQNNWQAFTFVLTRTAFQAYPTEGQDSVPRPAFQYQLPSCLAVQSESEPKMKASLNDQGDCFKLVFPNEVLRLKAEDQQKAKEWVEVLQEVVAAQWPALEDKGHSGEDLNNLQGVQLRTKSSREARQQVTSRVKRQSVTTSFLSILTCLAVEKGLTAQGFRCAGCQRPVGLSKGKAKVCYYSGWYYCQNCHDDNSFLIPARLLHNWDISKHKVSKQAKEFLEFVYEEPLLDVQQLNPCLYEHCEPLSTVLRLRQQLQSLRAYLFSCRAMVAEDLRRRIFPREYLLLHIHLYSIADLQQVIDGKLAPFLSKVIKFASSHVFNCSLCREKGFFCELCHNGQVLYPFQENVTKRCEGCGAVFHTVCRQKAQPCPRCVRRELHHKNPSSLWPPDDDSLCCFQLPYHDTFDA